MEGLRCSNLIPANNFSRQRQASICPSKPPAKTISTSTANSDMGQDKSRIFASGSIYFIEFSCSHHGHPKCTSGASTIDTLRQTYSHTHNTWPPC
jgi:hypothetical protein